MTSNNTLSFWSFVNHEKKRYMNPMYFAQFDIIMPTTKERSMRLWAEMYNPASNTVFGHHDVKVYKSDKLTLIALYVGGKAVFDGYFSH